MMPGNENLEAILLRLERGELDSLTAEQVAAIEDHLLSSPAASNRVSALALALDSARFSVAASPSASEWESVWRKIENRVASQRHARAALQGPARVVLFRRSVAAIAACVGFLAVWRVAQQPSASTAWEMVSSGQVEILSLETFGDVGAAIQFADDASGAVLISVYDRSDDTGA